MEFTVGTVWAIYIATLIIAFLLIVAVMYAYGNYAYGYAFLLASIVAAIAAFIGLAGLDTNNLSSTDMTWLNVLFFIAMLLPLFIIIWLVWAWSSSPASSPPCDKPCDKPVEKPCDKPNPCTVCGKPSPCACAAKIEQVVQCDRGSGECEVLEKKVTWGNEVTHVFYT